MMPVKFDLASFRDAARGLVEALLRTRLKDQPDFAYHQDCNLWLGVGLVIEDECHRSHYMLSRVKDLLDAYRETYVSALDTIPAPSATDGLNVPRLIESVSALFDGDLGEAIVLAKTGQAIDWQQIAHWELLRPIFESLSRIDGVRSPVKQKKSTQRGEAQLKLIAALTKHHEYAGGGCLKQDPIGCNALARLADVSKAKTSEFFKVEFGGHDKYRSRCGDSTRLLVDLKVLNREFSPRHLFGPPPGEDVHDRE